MLDQNIKSNRVPSDYDPYFQRDAADMERILHGFRQFPFLDESDLISRVPGRVFFGHSVHLNPNDRQNQDPRLALSEFQERIDRYNNRPLGADPMESPQMFYIRNLHLLRQQDQPSSETLNALLAFNLDRGMKGYEAKLAAASKAHYIEHEENNDRQREKAQKFDQEIQFRKKRAGHPNKQRLFKRSSLVKFTEPPHNQKSLERLQKLHRLRQKIASVHIMQNEGID